MFGRLTPVARNLIIINVAFLLIESLVQIRLDRILALHYIHSEFFFPTQYFTYMFMHADFYHLLFNMFGLLIFGPLLESFWGSSRFLIFYLVTGIGAGALYSGINFVELNGLREQVMNFTENPDPEIFMLYAAKHLDQTYFRELAGYIYEVVNRLGFKSVMDFAEAYYDNPNNGSYIQVAENLMESHYRLHANIPMVGASGAIFGILMAFGLLFPNTQLMLLFPPIPIKAKYLVLAYGIWTLFNIFQDRPGDNVAHFAHLGGMIFGFIMVKIFNSDRSKFY